MDQLLRLEIMIDNETPREGAFASHSENLAASILK